MANGIGAKPPRARTLLEWMEREEEVFVDAMLYGILDSVPELRRCKDSKGELKLALESHPPGIRKAFRDPSSEPTLPKEAEDWARRRVHDGVPLTAALRAFERGHAAASSIIGVKLKEGRWGLPPEVRAEEMEYASTCLFDYANAMTSQAISAYLDEQAKLERSGESSRVRAVTGLLQGDLDPSIAERSIAYRLEALHIGFTLWGFNGARLADLEAIEKEIRTQIKPWQQLTIIGKDGSLEGWLSCEASELRVGLRGLEPSPGIEVAFGSPHWGLAGFRLTHREAHEAKRVGQAIEEQAISTYDDLGVIALASRDMELAPAFVQGHLGPLAANDEKCQVLRETLRVFLQERGSPTSTADQLRLHRNTVVKRIHKIEEALNAPIDRGSLGLRVALELARVLPR